MTSDKRKNSKNFNVLGIITGPGSVILHGLSTDKSFFTNWDIKPSSYSIVVSLAAVIYLLKKLEEFRQQIKSNNRNNKVKKDADQATIDEIKKSGLTNKEKYDLILLLYTTTQCVQEDSSVSKKTTTDPTIPEKGKMLSGILKFMGFNSK